MKKICFTAKIEKFGEQGEKTGWTYIEIPETLAQQLLPGNKKSFRVKGSLDAFAIAGIALMPMGNGNFVMALNASIRKGIRKSKGASLDVKLEVDNAPILPPKELIECLNDEPAALERFNSLAKGHQNYFTKWIESAKTEATKTKRIAAAVDALSRGQDFGEMIRSMKQHKKDLLS